MNVDPWIWLASLAGLSTALSAMGAKVLHEISWHALEQYCRRRQRRQVFEDAYNHYDRVAMAVETLTSLSAAMLVVGLANLLLRNGWASWSAAEQGKSAVGLALGWLTVTVWIPWAVARLWSETFLFHTWRLWWWASYALLPLTWCASMVEAMFRRLSARPDKLGEEEAFEEEIRTMVAEGEQDGLMEADAREMIEGIMALGDADVADAMTPRSMIDAIPVEMPWPELLRTLIDYGHTRIPVYEGELDHVVGILFVKDILPELAESDVSKRKPLANLLRTASFVPTTSRLDDVLQDFRSTRNHLAIVIDEYGTVTGLITIEDVLEEIVGEIADELDEEPVDPIRRIDEHLAEIHGGTHVAQINTRLGIELPVPEDVDTVGGLVVHHLRRIPRVGESLEVSGVRLHILEATSRRVERVSLEILGTSHRGAHDVNASTT